MGLTENGQANVRRRGVEYGHGTQGKLKLFVGAAPGVGKTYTMLREARALKERGIDVVVGFVDTHDRPDTAAQIGDLEVLPRKRIVFQGREFEEVDLEAICRRAPRVAVIDELAHSNAPGSLHAKRYMDVEYLLDQGVSVLTAVNVQHIEGANREAESITGVRVRELIPQSFLRRAAEVAVIDVTPETLRQRLLDGNIYPRDEVNQALGHFFRKSNLSALRELALREVAEDVNERLENSFARRKIPGPVGAKETIMVCCSYLPRAMALIRRGNRMAHRMNADLYMLTVADMSEDQMTEKDRERIAWLKQLAEEHDAVFLLEHRNDRRIGEVILDAAARHGVTQIVIGQPARGRRWQSLWRHNPVSYLLRRARYIDLRIVGWETHLHMPLPTLKQDDARRDGRLEKESVPATERDGRLTIYIGSAPGVGKTYKMLQDAHDWKRKGIDVVVGLVETHGREETAAQIGDLEVLPKRTVCFEGRTYEEFDVEAALLRRPDVLIVDELAHTNVPGSLREKRYQDIEYLLERGINVVTAVNVQHLESLHDKVEHITGVKVRERVPDWFMDLAREIRLIDVTPETLQLRLLNGQIYSLDKVEQALSHFFDIANLSALREMALLEVADDVEQRLDRLRPGQALDHPEHERILVCVNHRPHSEKLIRRGWRLADRLQADLFVLVVFEGELSPQDQRDLESIERLSAEFDATFITRRAGEQGVGATMASVARELGVSQLVAGQPLPPRGWLERWRMNPVDYMLAQIDFVDLHIVAHSREQG